MSRKVFKWISFTLCAAMIALIWVKAGVAPALWGFCAVCWFASFAGIEHAEHDETMAEAVEALMQDLLKIADHKEEAAE